VHYVRFAFDAEARARLVAGAVLAVRHPEYSEATVLRPETLVELAADLEGRSGLSALG
jgi:hypothetical protein